MGDTAGDDRRPQVLGEVAVVRALDLLDGIHGVLLSIGGTTIEKWCPNLETPAPTHTETISSFSATIMSTNGRTPKKTIAGRYCSLRAAMKIDLVAQTDQHQEHDQRKQHRRADQSGSCPGAPRRLDGV